MKYELVIGQNRYDVDIQSIREGVALVTVNTKSYEVAIDNYAEVMAQRTAPASAPAEPSPPAGEAAAPRVVAPPRASAPAAAPVGSLGVIVAPIPGLIMDVLVKVGDRVGAGHVLLIMEAMKMLNNITASVAGVVREIRVQKGSEVSTGDVLVVIG
jgi:glutaconyl-CoA/methylmalonyl-CoA decarboxylase subunit gamma